MPTRIPNSSQAGPAPAPPARPDGQPYRYEMIYGAWRGYADTAGELAGLLIPGYDKLTDDTARLRARIHYAADVHVPLQASVAADGDLGACTAEQRAILLGARDKPPAVTEWQAPVPLVLVSSFYAPDGPLPRPAPAPGSEIIWIEPQTSDSLLSSLHAAGWISLAGRGDEPAASG
jgi:hypothetical protein